MLVWYRKIFCAQSFSTFDFFITMRSNSSNVFLATTCPNDSISLPLWHSILLYDSFPRNCVISDWTFLSSKSFLKSIEIFPRTYFFKTSRWFKHLCGRPNYLMEVLLKSDISIFSNLFAILWQLIREKLVCIQIGWFNQIQLDQLNL